MSENRISNRVFVLLAFFWAAFFSIAYWLIGASPYVNRPARIGVAFALSGLAVLAVFKLLKIEKTPS